MALLEDDHPAEMACVAGALDAAEAAPALHELLMGLPGAHSLAEIGLRAEDLDDAAALLEEELGLDAHDARELLEAAQL